MRLHLLTQINYIKLLEYHNKSHLLEVKTQVGLGGRAAWIKCIHNLQNLKVIQPNGSYSCVSNVNVWISQSKLLIVLEAMNK